MCYVILILASTVRVLVSECCVPNLWGSSPLSCSLLPTIWFRSLATQLPSDGPSPFPLPTSPSLRICGADLQEDVEQRDRAEDGYLVGGREALCLIVEKSVVSTRAADAMKKILLKKTTNAEGCAVGC